LTKSITSGTLSLLSELAAGHLAGSPPAPLSAKERTGIPPVDFLKRNHKALKLAAYGEISMLSFVCDWFDSW